MDTHPFTRNTNVQYKQSERQNDEEISAFSVEKYDRRAK